MMAACSVRTAEKFLAELVEGMPVRVLGRTDIPVTGIAYDSRLVRPGNLFAAVPGRRKDGRGFIPDALARGAAVVLAPGEQQIGWRGATLVAVRDVRAALAEVSRRFWDDPSADVRVVGVTGTNGKTTVCFLLRHILESAGVRTGLIGTVYYVMGQRMIPAVRTTPEAPDIQAMLAAMKRERCRAAAMEVSSHGLDQKRADGVHFRVAVFTNLARDHLDYHGDMESYYRAKRRLFELAASDGGTAVVNVDDPWGRRLAAEMEDRMRVVRCALRGAADWTAREIAISVAGSRFRLVESGQELGWGVQMPLAGGFNVSNALLAVAAARCMGVAPERAVEALRSVPAVPGRMEEVPGGRGFRVYVDYAHTPDGLREVLRAARSLARGRVLVVFGCGGDRDRGKRPLMGRVAGELADLVFLTSDNPRSEDPEAILAAIESGLEGRAYHKIVDRRAAIAAAIDCARPGDIVVIAGKGHEAYQEVGNRLVPFDDRAVAAALLGAGDLSQ